MYVHMYIMYIMYIYMSICQLLSWPKGRADSMEKHGIVYCVPCAVLSLSQIRRMWSHRIEEYIRLRFVTAGSRVNCLGVALDKYRLLVFLEQCFVALWSPVGTGILHVRTYNMHIPGSLAGTSDHASLHSSGFWVP